VITRRSFLGSTAAGLLSAQNPVRNNILVIIADDLNVDVGCYGADVKTPNIDALAARGVRFERAYCQYPLCNPSRSSFLSGKRPETTRLYDQKTVLRQREPETVFLPDHFRANGYFVAGAGKVFHHAKPNAVGFSTYDPSETKSKGELAASNDRYSKPEGDRTPNWLAFDGPESEMGDTLAAGHVCDWMEQAKRESKPFLLFAGMKKPHLPWAVPKKYFAMYPRVALRQEPPNKDIPKLALITELLDSKPPASRSEAVAAYRAATSYCDAQVGAITRKLDELGLRETTTVIFIGDNGFHLGDHGLWSKHTLFERATRVPMIWAGPKIAKGVSPRTVELLDIYPTLVALSGLPTPASGLEGKNLTPLLTKPDAEWRRAARSVVQRDKALGRSVITERWRYVEWDGGREGVELYDHEFDPGEFTNLAGKPENAERIKRLRALLDAPDQTGRL
jgi:uncharacterized sulfatase